MEREEEARMEELKNDPMKQLEERTVASNNEMKRADGLEELQELNRRTVSLNHDSMFEKLLEERSNAEAEVTLVERDEEFVRSIFSRDHAGDKIKRIHDDSDEEEEERVAKKVSRLETATDHLVEKKPTAEKAVWEKSVGISSKKCSLGALVKKKTSASPLQCSSTKDVLPKETTSVKSMISKPSASSSSSRALELLGNYSGLSSGSESE